MAGQGVYGVALLPCGANQLVTWIGDQWSPGIADKRHCFRPQFAENAFAKPVVAMIIIGRHRHLRADVGEQLGRDPLVFRQNIIGITESFGRAGGYVAEIADRRRDDVEAGGKRLVHLNSGA